MLGVAAAPGPAVHERRGSRGRAGHALLGHGTWMRRYGGDPAVVGRKLILNGLPYEVVGVLPERFSLPREVLPTLGGAEDAEIIVPLPLAADAPNDPHRGGLQHPRQAQAGRVRRRRRRPSSTR